MRWKIIAVNGAIAIVVAVVTYLILSRGLAQALSEPSERKAAAEQALTAANDRLQLDALQLERWLDPMSDSEAVRNVYLGGTAQARGQAATAQANQISDSAAADASMRRLAPQLVLFVDAQGVSLGRNGSELTRGENFAARHPALAGVLQTGQPGSDIWVDRKQQEQLLVSYAPIRSATREILGALVVGGPLSDDRLTVTSKETSGAALIVGVPSATALELIATSAQATSDVMEDATGGAVDAAAKRALEVGSTQVLSADSHYFGAAPLRGYGAGKAVLIAALPSSMVPGLASLVNAVFAVALGGLILIVITGFILGAYITRPIGELEEGLLAIVNGQSDLRFDTAHPETGGLAHGLNTLLNSMMGVEETDETGRASVPHGADTFRGA